MIERLLIANRGEIACRIAHTAHRLGITPIALYSRSDAGAAHVRSCREAIALMGQNDRQAYLDGTQILAAAQRCGAQAIHPGYGFLSERAEFAQACTDAGLIFVGPPAHAMHAMGLKAESKRQMMAAGVPVLPGYHDADQTHAVLTQHANLIGFPLLIKASAGGGGKGMRIVRSAHEFLPALHACQREALASFANSDVILERYVDPARHIEVQIFADQHGHVVYLGDRDCSIQRRHQKIIEEAPAPGLTEAMRAAMGQAAVAAARAVDYVGAGTVEFIMEPSGAFYFMEMNTRLQVEHPITEMVTGLDLVAWQLHIAAGQPLPWTQEQVRVRGVALEARLYAEQPERDFLPSGGTVRHLSWPRACYFNTGMSSEGVPAAVRLDSGINQGDTLSSDFDPMIAKLIVWGEDRTQALSRLRQALAESEIVGPHTNRNFLGRVLRCPSMIEARLDTALIQREAAALAPPETLPPMVLALAVLAMLYPETNAPEDNNPWSVADYFRLQGFCHQVQHWAYPPHSWTLPVTHTGASIIIDHPEAPITLHDWERNDTHLSVRCHGRRWTARVIPELPRSHVFFEGVHWTLETRRPPNPHRPGAEPPPSLCAPMPGRVLAVHVTVGQTVHRSQPLLVIEAMKMELTLCAPQDGTVTALPFTVHDTVSEGVALVQFSPHPSSMDALDAPLPPCPGDPG
jgi:3-methylcrotonyl-CoA carboxylase alpha subunit